MKIHELKQSDLAKLLALYKHLHKSDSIAPVKVAERTWNQIQENTNIKYFGAYLDDALVSTCTIALIPNLTRSCCPYGLIENVVTHSSYREKGYGASVLKTALDFAWENNCYKVMLMTGRLDKATFKFYESAGFIRNEKEAFIAFPVSLCPGE